MRSWAFVAVTAIPCALSGQTVRGTVADKASGQPIAGVSVALLDMSQAVVGLEITSDSGVYLLSAPSPGAYLVRAQRIGFRPALSGPIQLRASEGVTFPVVMESVPIELSAVRVERPNIALEEFEGRRRFGIGHFLTRDQLDKYENRNTGDVISMLPGAGLVRAGSAAWVTSGRRPPGGTVISGDASDRRRGARAACYADVWLDNARLYIYRPGEPLFDINSIQPSMIEGIEYYNSPATIPGRYARGGTAQCAALVLWSRRSG
jgi:hypothetical protein